MGSDSAFKCGEGSVKEGAAVKEKVCVCINLEKSVCGRLI